MCLFQTPLCSRELGKENVGEMFTVASICQKREFFPRVIWWYFARIKWRKALCGVAYFISAEKVFYSGIFGYCCQTVLGSKSDAVVRALASHQKQCGSGSNPGVDAICRLSLLLVLSLSPSGFSPVFLSLKTTTSEFQFGLEHTGTFQRVLKNS